MEISWSSGEVAQVVVLQVQLLQLSHVLHGRPLEFNQTVVRQAEDSEIFDSLQHASSQHFEAVVAQIEFVQVVGAERLVRNVQQLVVRQRQRVQLLSRQTGKVAQVRVVQSYRPAIIIKLMFFLAIYLIYSESQIK